MFRCIKYSRHYNVWMMVLIAVVVGLTTGLSIAYHDSFGQGMGFVLVVITGIYLINWLVDIGLRRAFKVAYRVKFMDRASSKVIVILSFLAENIHLAVKAEQSIKTDGSHAYEMKVLDARNSVRCALRRFWRAHWLAMIFDFEVMKSWKDYLPPAQTA
jgi:hypothetical protein